MYKKQDAVGVFELAGRTSNKSVHCQLALSRDTPGTAAGTAEQDFVCFT